MERAPAADFQDGHSAGDRGAVLLHNLDSHLGIDPAKDLSGHFRPGDDRPLLGDGTGRGLLVFADKILAGDIAGPDVLAQGEIDQLEIIGGQRHPPTMREESRSTSGAGTKKDPGRAREEKPFECESVPPPESP